MDKKNKNPSNLGDILKDVTKQSILDIAKEEAKKERHKAYDFRKIFEQMELDLISSMKRAFYFHQEEQIKEGFQWEQWQLVKLREMEKYRKRNKAILGEYKPAIEKVIQETLEQSFEKGQDNVEKQIDTVKDVLTGEIKLPKDEITEKVAKSRKPQKTIIEQQGMEDVAPNKVIDVKVETPKIPQKVEELPKAPREENFFGVNDKKLEALQETITNDLNEGQQAAFRKMDDIYRQIIYKAEINMSAGAKTLNQAVDMATKEFLDKGVNCIEYKDGTRVNIASYAEMALRTASHRATLLGEGKKRDEWGIHLVVVSAHANTCEMCEPWQGKVLIDDVFSHPSKEYLEENKKYPLLSKAIEKGLLH